MAKIAELLNSKKGHKIIVTEISDLINNDNSFLELMDSFRNGSDVDKGTLAEVMKFVSEKNPQLFLPFIDELIEYINYKAPRVKWGVPESIGHIAKKYPKEVEKGIPRLLINIRDESTVIRWCAAYALTEIAKYNKKVQNELVSRINGLIKIEENNGVKNIYLKGLKFIEKTNT